MFGRTEKQTITVDGMSCGHCEQRVEKTVGALEGIKKVKASHKNRNVVISYDKGMTLDVNRIREAIGELGFEVK